MGFTFDTALSRCARSNFPYGYIGARAHKTNTYTIASTMCFTYGHQQYGIGVTPSISFSGVSVSIGPILVIDHIDISTLAKGF